jgi:hypothetical protein
MCVHISVVSVLDVDLSSGDRAVTRSRSESPVKRRRISRGGAWSDGDEALLLDAANRDVGGYGRWVRVLALITPRLAVKNRTTTDLKDKYRNLGGTRTHARAQPDKSRPHPRASTFPHTHANCVNT